MKVFLAILVSFGIYTSLNGQQSDGSNGGGDSDNDVSYPDYPVDLHDNNRGIAFASVILAGEGGDPASWKAVDFYSGYYCYPEPIPVPVPNPEDPVQEDEQGGPVVDLPPETPVGNRCLGEAYFTTNYELVECEDGRAFIVRSGEGVSLTSETTGEVFGWAEGVACGPYVRSREIVEGQSLNLRKPLNRQGLIISPR